MIQNRGGAYGEAWRLGVARRLPELDRLEVPGERPAWGGESWRIVLGADVGRRSRGSCSSRCVDPKGSPDHRLSAPPCAVAARWDDLPFCRIPPGGGMSGEPQAHRNQAGDDGTSNDVAGCGCSIVLFAIGYFLAAHFGDEPGSTGRSAIALFGGLCILLALMAARQTWAERRQRRRTWVAPVTERRTGVLTWRDAELLAVQHMRAIGFLDARDTGPGSDGGIDAVATGAVAQVKMHQKPIGRPDIQRLVGAAAGQQPVLLLYYSFSGFTSTAHAYADERGVVLFGFDRTGAVQALNAAAMRALRPT